MVHADDVETIAAEFRAKFCRMDLSIWDSDTLRLQDAEERKTGFLYTSLNSLGLGSLLSYFTPRFNCRIARNAYSLLADIPVEDKAAFVRKCVETRELDRAIGCFVGLAVADSIGHFLEFLPATAKGQHAYNLANDSYINELNVFGLKRGQWTDDCSMALCIADSLLLHDAYDGSDVRIRFANWWFCGYNNAFRVANRSRGVELPSQGLGGNISKSLYNMTSGVKPTPRYEKVAEDAGNGSIMRLAPVALRYRKTVEAMEVAMEQSHTTHPGDIAAEACRLLAFIIHAALESSDETAQQMLDRAVAAFVSDYQPEGRLSRLLAAAEPSTSLEVCWNWREPMLAIEQAIVNRGPKYNGYPNKADYFGSFCLDGLAIALHAVYTTASFDTCIAKCVNYLGDADTTGAIAGQIAGAFYGYSAIPLKWRQDLVQWDEWDIPVKAALLYL